MCIECYSFVMKLNLYFFLNITFMIRSCLKGIGGYKANRDYILDAVIYV